MTHRQQLIETARQAVISHDQHIQEDAPAGYEREIAEAVVDAVLPQIHTVAELDALYERAPRRTGQLDQRGDTHLLATVSGSAVELSGPLTIVWQPS